MSRRILVRTPVLAALLFLGCRGGYWGTSGYYRTAQLDTQSLRLRVSGALGLNEPDFRHFFRFTDARGHHLIADCEPRHGEEPQTCYNLFEVGGDNKLEYRTKYLRLLKGPYGTVYAEVQYFYDARYAKQKNSLDTRLYLNDLRQVPPAVSGQFPGLSEGVPSAISVVRVFKAAPEFLVASANYSSDGHLYELHVYGAKGGNWVHSNELVAPYSGKFNPATTIGDDKETREYFGLPGTFPVAAYLSSRAKPFARVLLESVLDVVNLHFDESRIVRQDTFVPGSKPRASYLTFPSTKEDEALGKIDHTRGFADIEYTRGDGK
jgi:hypothetical protein